MARVDSLQQGSWNGVVFQYLDAGWNPGLRGQLHEYPNRDQGYFEPLGKRTAQFTLDVFVVGDDWIQQRQALAQAFGSGTGTLIHPLDGRMSAICIDVQIKETVTELGRVGLTVTFLPGNQAQQPAQPDTGGGIDTASSTAQTASQATFSNSFAYQNEPVDVQAAAQNALGDALDAIGAAAGFVGGVVNTVENTIGAATAWFNYGLSSVGTVIRIVLNEVSAVLGTNLTVDQLTVSWAGNLGSTASAIAILGSYPALPQQLAALVEGLSGLEPTGSGDPFVSWSQQRRAGVSRTVLVAASSTDASAGYVTQTTGGYSADTVRSVFQQQLTLATTMARPSPAVGADPQSTTNANAISDVVRQAALIEAAGAFSAIPFTSRQDAFIARDQIASALDAECNLVTDGTVRLALSALRLSVIADAKARSAGLPDVRTAMLSLAMPALVMAAALYDDPGMAADLVARNGVINPLFMPAGVSLEVLSSG
jgi:prophage DNA circulation protein